jgi:lipopolysaccharide heptosyltransferase II
MKTDPSFEENDIHNILLWMPSWIGDVILALPAVEALRKRFPDARITSAGPKSSLEILVDHPDVDSVIEIPGKRESSLVQRLWFAKNLKKYRFDLGVVFPNSIGSALMLRLSGAKIRIGHNTERREFLLTHPIAITEDIKRKEYRVDYFLNILSPLDVQPPQSRGFKEIKRKSPPAVNDFIHKHGLKKNDFLVAVHPGTSKAERSWLPERFGILCQKLLRDHRMKFLLLGTPNEVDLLEQIKNFCPPGTVIPVTNLGLRDVSMLIKKSKLFIGNDSGMMHLAAYVGTPVVGIFGPGNPGTSGPYMAAEKQEIVTKSYSCSPCRQRFFKECKPSPHNRPYCLEDISVGDVADAVQRLLEKTGKKKSVVK